MEKSGEYDDDAGLENRWVSVGGPVSGGGEGVPGL